MRLIVLAALLGLLHAQPTRADDLEVATRQGVVTGSVADAGVRVFRGIPYAAPPIGEARWTPPGPAPSWTGERAADRFGLPCAQFDPAKMAQARRHSDEGLDVFFNAPMAAGGTEDCLTLNVWTPAKAAKAPVIVYLYGGGGSADMPFWNGAS